MSICESCGDTRISYTCEIVGEGHGRYAWWPACPACASIPRLQHMAQVYAIRRRLPNYDADGWLSLFRPDDRAEIRRLVGTAVQMRLPMM